MSLCTRVIAAILIHNGNVVQTRKFRVTNVVGRADIAVEYFHRWNADEFIVLNIDHKPNDAIVSRLAQSCFVPITVGGGVDSVERASELFRCGADKVAINTAALGRPVLITELARKFGRQAVVISIDADDQWMARNNGRPIVAWAREAVDRGAGEVLLNSVEHDGDQRGYDLDLLRVIDATVPVPVIMLGGVSKWDHMLDGIRAGAHAVAAGNALHYTEHSVRKAKEFLKRNGVLVREG